MAKPRFESIAPIRRGDALLGAIAPQLDQVPPATPQPATPQPATPQPVTPREPPRQPSPQPAPADAPRPEAFVLRLSPDVFRQIDTAATGAGVTMTVIIARALQQAGFTVPAEDLRDRRKRRHRDA